MLHLRTLLPVSETVSGQKCIDEARSFVSGLSRSFKSMLREAIDDVYRKCRGCHFHKIVLDPYLRQLEDKKKCMEEPKLALENFARIKEEVAAIIE